MLHALSVLSSEQNTATEATEHAANHLLDYAATHPNATLRFVRSDMILHIHSDASYLTATKARSRYSRWFFLADKP